MQYQVMFYKMQETEVSSKRGVVTLVKLITKKSSQKKQMPEMEKPRRNFEFIDV